MWCCSFCTYWCLVLCGAVHFVHIGVLVLCGAVPFVHIHCECTYTMRTRSEWVIAHSASRAPGVFGDQALHWSEFLVVVSSTSCCCTVYHCILYKVNSYWNHYLFSELSPASVRVQHTRAAAAAHLLEIGVSRCRTSQFVRCFLPAQTRVWNDLPYTVFDSGTLDGFKGAVNRWLLPWVCFSVFRGAGACGVAKEIYKQLCFSNLGLCCWF